MENLAPNSGYLLGQIFKNQMSSLKLEEGGSTKRPVEIKVLIALTTTV